MTPREQLAKRLQLASRAKGWGSTALANAMSNLLGLEITQQRADSWLSGTVPREPEVLVALCLTLGVDQNYVFTGDTRNINDELRRLLTERDKTKS